jgi:cleavage and polyadenylation specificity factor subunit 2
MYEFAIQKKELGVFDLFSLKNVESAFEKLQLVPFGENKRLKMGNTELIVSALPSGNGIGGTAWKIEFQKQTLIYALELNDKPT